MNKLLSMAIIAIIATGLLSVPAIGLLQHASAVSDNANPVGQTVSKDGISGNQNFMQSCKESYSTKDCANGFSASNGEFTSNLAHEVNGPD